ncbi:FAD-binding oxidoreductase [Streptomyces sp. SID13031]|uniref:FAD-binding oxidoreductase n=1 Tax=Streptomyces sp. SID13031 TaxID=2706046 RepID=UPI0013CB6B12|nr:FAD-binding oxidoreductase [Streptomyces sp. SID13031]NEA34262.1 FAD-binding oxidoreductase [Streptomyces sp. SID13031]
MSLIDELRAAVKGRVIGPDDAEYDVERQAWFLLVDQRPAAVVHVTGTEDVQAAIRLARRHRLTVGAQPVGHGASGATSSGMILLRTGALDAIDLVTTETGEEIVRVGAGVRWRDLNKALTGSGLTSLPGSSGDPTVVGYTLNGGVSWFGRKHGFAANHVRAIELVDAEGHHLRVTKDAFPDLFWALRGGGGEFAIVTAMELELLPEPQIYGGRMMWYAEDARELLRAFSQVTATAPEELSLWAWMINMPDLEFVPPPMRGRWMVAIDSTFLGDGDDAEKLLAPIRAVAEPLVDGVGEVPLDKVGEIAQEPEDPMPGVGKVAMLKEFDQHTIDALLELVLDRPAPSPLMLVEIRHVGGAFTRPGAHESAVGTMEDPYFLLLGGMAMAPEHGPAIQAEIDTVVAGLAPWAGGLLPPTMAHGEPVEEIHDEATLVRLREIKNRVDPGNLIRGNHPLV